MKFSSTARLLLIPTMIASLSLGPAMARAETGGSDLAERPAVARGDEITPEQQEAVRRGLEWLAARQNPDGSFAATSGMGAQTAVVALAGLAFMSAGNVPGRGQYGDNVERCVEYILRSSQESGLLAAEQSHGVMYSHGFAALFLAEVYGMTGDERVKDRLQRAIRGIQKWQNHEGGWRYQPAPIDADVSVTICQVMALRAARDAGIRVEKEVIDKAVEYVRNCQNADGGFRYMARQGGGSSAFPRSAAGVATLYYAGIFEGEEITRGLDYLLQFTPGEGGSAVRGGGSHYFYGQYYAAQAMFLAGGDYWATWYPAIRDELIARQSSSGEWSDSVGSAYGTAVALIVLQMPNRYLPVFNGVGPGS